MGSVSPQSGGEYNPRLRAWSRGIHRIFKKLVGEPGCAGEAG
jgi:hypothetical protein